jgi:hypothetical protein
MRDKNYILESRVVDPEPHRSALILVGWIQIRIKESKNYPQK